MSSTPPTPPALATIASQADKDAAKVVDDVRLMLMTSGSYYQEALHTYCDTIEREVLRLSLPPLRVSRVASAPTRSTLITDGNVWRCRAQRGAWFPFVHIRSRFCICLSGVWQDAVRERAVDGCELHLVASGACLAGGGDDEPRAAGASDFVNKFVSCPDLEEALLPVLVS